MRLRPRIPFSVSSQISQGGPIPSIWSISAWSIGAQKRRSGINRSTLIRRSHRCMHCHRIRSHRCNRLPSRCFQYPQWASFASYRQRHIGEGGPVEIGQKCGPGPLQPALQSATSNDGAGPAVYRKTCDQGLSILQYSYYVTQSDLLRRSRQDRPAACAAPGGNDARLRKGSHDLGQMMSR